MAGLPLDIHTLDIDCGMKTEIAVSAGDPVYLASRETGAVKRPAVERPRQVGIDF